MYYTSMEYMKQLYDRTRREYRFQAETLEQFSDWKARTRGRLREIIGLDCCTRAETEDAKLLKETDKGTYLQQYWTLQTEPGVYVPFYILRPKADGPRPLILNPHGHGGGKEKTLGDLSKADVRERYRGGDKTFAVTMAERGYVVVCPDARGAGERRERDQQGEDLKKLQENSHLELLKIGIGFGIAPIGWLVWDLMRLLDFMEKQPYVDAARIAAAGMSGGGHQSLWLGALDDRVRVIVTSGYFYGMKEALLEMPENCPCNYVPNIWKTVDMGDIGALLAPRPFLVESGTCDLLNGKSGIENVYSQVDIARKAYRLFGKGDMPVHSVHGGGHVWMGTDIVPFVENNL